MARIGFTREPDFEGYTLELDSYKTYGGYVQYKADLRKGRHKVDPSFYVPKTLLPHEGFPEKIHLVFTAAPKTLWRKYSS